MRSLKDVQEVYIKQDKILKVTSVDPSNCLHREFIILSNAMIVRNEKN